MAKVLVVDDDEDIRTFFHQIISAVHHEVYLARDAEEAKSIIMSEEGLDVALVDRILPGNEDGLDILEFIQASQPLCQTILISGYPTFNSASKALRHCAFDYLTKPVQMKQLYKVINAAINEKRIIAEKIFDAEKNKQGYKVLRSKQEILQHDMRSLLIGINGFINLLINKTSLDEKQAEYCKQIQQCSIHLEDMVNTYLDISNSDQENFQLNKTKFNILDIIQQSREALGFLAEEKNIDVSLIFKKRRLSIDDVLYFEGDPVYLQNSITNLLKNAIEASPCDQSIRIRIEDLREYILISIHNWGTIPEDMRYTFFNKYASSGKKSGVGLGTYIAHLVVKAHDGEITINSSENEGTDISILLPRNKILEAKQSQKEKSIQVH